MRKCIVFSLMALAAIVAPAIGAPLAPPLSTMDATAGETAMLSTNCTPSGYVDWMVLPGGSYANTDFAPLVQQAFGGATDIPMGQFLYAYKVESLIDNGSSLTVSLVDAGLVSNVGSSNMDLDAVGHNATNFANLGPPPPEEFTFTDKRALVADDGSPIIDGNNLTWNFEGNLGEGRESVALWFVSSSTPSYRPVSFDENSSNEGILGDTDGDSGNDGCQPTPVPAPGAVLLGMIGLGLINWIQRRLA